MFEVIVVSATFAVVAATTVSYLHLWAIRVRLRRLEMGLAEWEERLVKEVKQRAAAASVAARTGVPKFNPVDEALMRQGLRGGDGGADAPWWDKLVK